MSARRAGAVAVLIATVGALALAIGGCSLTPFPVPADPPPTAADQGAALFESPALSANSFNTYTCATCHGPDAPSASSPLRPGAPLAGVVDRPTYWGGTEIDLLRAVNHCLMYFMLQDEPWTGTEPEAVQLYAYLESLSESAAATSEPAPFTIVKLPVDLPNGDATRGQATYDRACASCHGALHTGDSKLVDHAPTLPEDVLASHPAPDFTEEQRRLAFVFKIRHGGFMGNQGQMPPFSTELLGDADVSDLLALFFTP